MSCSATGPINLEHTDNKCFNKCRFSYDFKNTTITAKNKKEYISIELADKDTVTAQYSSANTRMCRNGGNSRLSVQEIRVYAPSLHTYGSNKERADAELFILLNNTSGGRHVIVSVPISTQNGTMPLASSALTDVISFLAKMGNSEDEGGDVKGLNFNLNDFIPQNVGFYSYVASVPWDPCEKCTDYIVYDKKDAVISINNLNMSILGRLIENQNDIVSVNDNSDDNKLGFAYNKRGAIRGLGTSDNKIWINCYPTGSDGKILVDESKRGVLSNNSFGMYSGISQKKFEKYKTIALTIIVSVASVLGLLFFMYVIDQLVLGGKTFPNPLKGMKKFGQKNPE